VYVGELCCCSMAKTECLLIIIAVGLIKYSVAPEDMIVTPFAQILQSLRSVRDNYVVVINLQPPVE